MVPPCKAGFAGARRVSCFIGSTRTSGKPCALLHPDWVPLIQSSTGMCLQQDPMSTLREPHQTSAQQKAHSGMQPFKLHTASCLCAFRINFDLCCSSKLCGKRWPICCVSTSKRAPGSVWRVSSGRTLCCRHAHHLSQALSTRCSICFDLMQHHQMDGGTPCTLFNLNVPRRCADEMVLHYGHA